MCYEYWIFIKLLFLILDLFLLNLVFLALLWILDFLVLSLTYNRSVGTIIHPHLMNISHTWQRLFQLPYRLELDGFCCFMTYTLPLQVIIQFSFPDKIITYDKYLENTIYIELWRLFNKHQRYIFILTLLSHIRTT
jgi:hypothetical protein